MSCLVRFEGKSATAVEVGYEEFHNFSLFVVRERAVVDDGEPKIQRELLRTLEVRF
jgi:hypothetical protein